MAIQLAPLIMAGGKAALTKLPLIMGVGAALPALQQGRPIEAAVRGGLGYVSGMPLGGIARTGAAGATRLAGQLSPEIIAKLGGPVAAKQILLGTAGLGAGALALKGGQIAGDTVGPATTQALGGVGQTGAGLLGYQGPGSPYYGGSGLPPGTGMYGGVNPYGSPLDVLGPAGMGMRLQTIKDAETMRDAMRLLNPEILAAAEARSKKEFERGMAAAGIRQNIATRAAMIQNAQRAGLNTGMKAAEQAGSALTRQYQYT